jgi:hypothetical protein
MPLENGECDWGTEALEKWISNTATNTDNGYKIREKFYVNETVENVSKGRSGRPRSSTHGENVATKTISKEVCKAV